MTSLIKLLVVDDHIVVRKALRSLLTSKYGLEVIGEAADGVEAIDMARDLQPDVILMDLVMPGKNGIEATQGIAKNDPDARVLILTSFSDEDQIAAAVKSGAMGYVLKDASPDELINAIHGVYMGKVFLPANMLRLLRSDIDVEP